MALAALFVATGGSYYGIEGVDPWDEARDARLYSGPHRVVAHPPCERWGRYWSGGPSAKVRRKLGDDNGCFKSALHSVRTWGGVLEHPEGSHAFRQFGLGTPPKSGGWVESADGIGHTCCVEQGHYGHRARKATWLYAVGTALPALAWGPCGGKPRMDAGFHSAEERALAVASGWTEKALERLSKTERTATPALFRDQLILIAGSNP